LLEDCFICQNASLVRRGAYDAVGAFRPDLIRSQDYEMAIRLARHFKAIYVPEVMFLQRTHEGERGSAGDRFDSTKQFAKWLHYDAIFFRELYDTIPLSMLVPNGIPDSSEEIGHRAALLQRACIFARKKLWQLSLSDLDKAVRMNPHTPLTGVESRICRRFLVSKFGCDELVTDPEIARALCAISDTGDVAHMVIMSVTAPLLWHARHALTSGELGLSKGFVAILARVYGYQEIATMLLSAVRRRILSAG
jgi:hypothetical protein